MSGTQTELCFEHKIMPSPSGSDNEVLLHHLLRGERITSAWALDQIGTSRLSARVFNLREDGWPVCTTDVTVSKRNGKRATIAEYWMEIDE